MWISHRTKAVTLSVSLPSVAGCKQNRSQKVSDTFRAGRAFKWLANTSPHGDI